MNQTNTKDPWYIDRVFEGVDVPKFHRKEVNRYYAYPPAYHELVCEIFAYNNGLKLSDVKLLMFLYKNKHFTFQDLEEFPHKIRRWGTVTRKKTFTFLDKKGWFKVHKNNSRSNPRIFAFSDEAKSKMNSLYRVLYLADPIDTSKFPVEKHFHDNPSYMKAIHDINQMQKKLKAKRDLRERSESN